MAYAKYKIGNGEITVGGNLDECKSLLSFVGIDTGKANTTEKIADISTETPGLREEVVAIYDNSGIPSIMRRFTKVTNKELFGGSDKTHPAFIIGGKEYDEIYISVYENCEINGKPYSLPYMKPWTCITNDDAAKACFSKGDGWHLMTAAEWGLVANLCQKNGTMPRGNTDRGCCHGNKSEKGVLASGSSCITLTGSGPETWTHNHKSDGLHDLCGNVWEMVRGFRMKDGTPQYIKNNDAALDIDASKNSEQWRCFETQDGETVYVDATDEMRFTTDEDAAGGYSGAAWSDVKMDIDIPEEMKELAIYNGEGNAYCYLDATDGEYLAYRGGNWDNGSDAGVFSLYGSYGRAYSNTRIGFRSAYFRKTEN